MELREVAQELYGSLPGEFIAARNTQVTEAKSEDKALAQRIQQLRKPSAAAWVVNMLVRHRHEQMTQLLDVGASLRQAQADLDAAALRELTRQRRRLVSAVASDGRALAVELGEKVSDSVARQVEDTLTAAMMDEAAAAAVRSGLLVDPLVASGIGAVDVSGSVADPSLMGDLDQRFLAPAEDTGRAREKPSPATAEPTGHLSAVPAPDPEAARAEALADASRRLDEAREAAAKADRKRDKALKRVSRLEARSLQVQARIEELKRRLADLEHEAETVEAELEEAEEKRERAVERAETAAGAVRDAQADADRVGG